MQTVLAIDDSPDVLALLAVRLRPEGVRLITADNAERGVALANSEMPDIILLDVDMPDASGLDVCRRLKSEPATSAIPIIFLTGDADVDTKVHGFDLGAVDYVVKPFHPAELRARVRAALRMKRCQDLLAERANVDALTGLRNRAFFDERLEAELLASVRHGRRVSLVLFDLDYFKSINDTYGHPFGDLVLQHVGEAAAAAVRACDAACRYGGEELAFILTETPQSGGVTVAERVRQRLETLAFAPRGKGMTVTASFGVAEAVDVRTHTDDASPNALLEAADRALYEAKRAGRNTVRAFSTDGAVSVARSSLVQRAG